MRFTLKDYQEQASTDIMERLARARKLLDTEERVMSGFALAAPTGSGKTVIVSDVIETLIKGGANSDAWDDTVILWFSDSPELNTQSKYRISESSGRLYGHLEDITNDFSETELSPGNCYFINTQKFSKSSKLVQRPVVAGGQTVGLFDMIPPDQRQIGIWEVIANTLNNPDKQVILIVDEAHRGLGAGKGLKERNTILARLITGHTADSGTVVPPMPIVFGISATPDRFRDFLHKNNNQDHNRFLMNDVIVDPAIVQASGLLKDTIVLMIPGEKGNYHTNLLSEGTRKLKSMTDTWNQYCADESIPQVVPLMVVQVENKVTDDRIAEYIQAIRSEYPLPSDAFAHVFGEHSPLNAGGISVPHIRPESIQDREYIRVVFAKDAISTGWDCPRAEVLVSFRPASDDTHITQILGRMVRTPLARSVPGNDDLNSTTCILPLFREDSAIKVANMLSRDGDHYTDDDSTGGGKGRKVVINPVVLTSDRYPREIAVMEELPSYHIPTRTPRPITRLLNLATELERDKFYPNGSKEVSTALFKKMDGLSHEFSEEIARHVHDINTVEVTALVRDFKNDTASDEVSMTLEADESALRDAYKDATRLFGKQLSHDLVRYFMDSEIKAAMMDGDEIDDIEELLSDLRTKVAAMSRVTQIVDQVKAYASQESDRLAEKHYNDIESSGDDRRDTYQQLRDMSVKPVRVSMKAPVSLVTADKSRDGSDIPVYEHHVLSDDDGHAPLAGLNKWEKRVIEKESESTRFASFYRNPGTRGNDPAALSVPYKTLDDKDALLKPDFLFFHRRGDLDEIGVSIVDPHNCDLPDARVKLKGLAKFAEKHGDDFDRIDSVSAVGGDELRAIDFRKEEVRAAVMDDSIHITELYKMKGISRKYA